MGKLKTLAIIMLATSALVACGGGGGGGGGDSSTTTDTNGNTGSTGLTVGTAAKSGNNTYSVTSGGKTISATAQSGSLGANQPVYLNAVPVDGKTGYFSAMKSPTDKSDFVGAAAINSSSVFVGQSGMKAAPTATNEVVNYNGPVQVITPMGNLTSSINGSVDFGSGKFTAASNGNDLTLTGQVNGADVKGTSSFKGSAGKFDAGFYAAGSELNGVFAGDKNDYAGVFATSKK